MPVPEPDVTPEQLLRLEVSRDERTTTVHAHGEVDMHNTPMLRAELTKQLDATSQELVLDLSGVTFFASSGLAALVEIRAEAMARDIRFRLVTESRAVLRPLRATGLLEMFDVSR